MKGLELKFETRAGYRAVVHDSWHGGLWCNVIIGPNHRCFGIHRSDAIFNAIRPLSDGDFYSTSVNSDDDVKEIIGECDSWIVSVYLPSESTIYEYTGECEKIADELKRLEDEAKKEKDKSMKKYKAKWYDKDGLAHELSEGTAQALGDECGSFDESNWKNAERDTGGRIINNLRDSYRKKTYRSLKNLIELTVMDYDARLVVEEAEEDGPDMGREIGKAKEPIISAKLWFSDTTNSGKYIFPSHIAEALYNEFGCLNICLKHSAADNKEQILCFLKGIRGGYSANSGMDAFLAHIDTRCVGIGITAEVPF